MFQNGSGQYYELGQSTKHNYPKIEKLKGGRSSALEVTLTHTLTETTQSPITAIKSRQHEHAMDPSKH